MRKKLGIKVCTFVVITILLISALIVFSEKVHKLSLIKNIKQVLNLRRNYCY